MKGALAGALALAVVTVALNGQAPATPQPALHVGRSKIATKYGIVAASQPLAARAGVQILERGGNAVDAAIATNAVMGLVEPHFNGIGGDLFAIYYEARTKKLYGLNAGGWAPSGLTPQLLRSKNQRGCRTPASTRSPCRGRSRAGTCCGRASRGCPCRTCWRRRSSTPRTGFPSQTSSPRRGPRRRRKLAEGPHAAEVFLPAGHAPKAGEIFKNPQLAGTLKLIAAQGPAGFYEGRTAAAILSVERELGGTMTAADLKDYQPEWVEPISTTYRGWTVYELPPNTQGIAALMMLNIMEQFPLGDYGLTSTRAMHG